MRQAGTATRPTELVKSIDIEIVPGCNLALIELANFFQHLFFATRFAALLCARLVTACIAAVVQHQEMGLRSVRDLRKLPCRGMECLITSAEILQLPISTTAITRLTLNVEPPP